MSALDTFIGLVNSKIEVVYVPVADGKELIVRRLLVQDLPEIEAVMGEKTDTKQKMIGLLVLALCDENGDRLIKTDEHRAALEKMPLGVMRALFDKAAKINGLAEDDEGN